MNRPLTLIRRYTRGHYEHEDTLADAESPVDAEGSDCEITRSPLDLPLYKPSCIDNEYTDHASNPKVKLSHHAYVCSLSRLSLCYRSSMG